MFTCTFTFLEQDKRSRWVANLAYFAVSNFRLSTWRSSHNSLALPTRSVTIEKCSTPTMPVWESLPKAKNCGSPFVLVVVQVLSQSVWHLSPSRRPQMLGKCSKCLSWWVFWGRISRRLFVKTPVTSFLAWSLQNATILCIISHEDWRDERQQDKAK